MKAIAGAVLLAVCWGAVAWADIPINDDLQLTQKTQTQTTTTNTVPVQQNNNKGHGGINCATHTGQQGTTQNNTQPPNVATGNTAVQQYDPQASSAPTTPIDRAWVGDAKSGADLGRRCRRQRRNPEHDHGEWPHLSNRLGGRRARRDNYGRL